MLAGIGVIIVLKQIPSALGYTDLSEEGASSLSYIFSDFPLFVQTIMSQIHLGAIVITLISIAIF